MIPHVFISSITGMGIQKLKDILWTELSKDSNRIEGTKENIVHKPKNIAALKAELSEMGMDDEEYIFDEEKEDEEDFDDFEYEYEDFDEEDQ